MCLPATVLLLSEVVCLDSHPDSNLTKNLLRSDFFGEVSRLSTCSTIPRGRSSTVNRPTRVMGVWGRKRNFRRASQTWVIEGRSLGTLLQHFSRNNQTVSLIPAGGLWGVSPAHIIAVTVRSSCSENGIFPPKTWRASVRLIAGVGPCGTMGACLIDNHTNSVHITLFPVKRSRGFGLQNLWCGIPTAITTRRRRFLVVCA